SLSRLDTATTHISTLSLHDALPISTVAGVPRPRLRRRFAGRVASLGGSLRRARRVSHLLLRRSDVRGDVGCPRRRALRARRISRSEEHTSELQSRVDLVCRLLLEKK